MKDDSLFEAVSSIFQENSSMVVKEEPLINTPDEALIHTFTKEQSARRGFQPILIIGLIIFLIIQLIYMNQLYQNSVDALLNLNDINLEMAEYYFQMYNNILSNLKFYTTSILCEFIAMFYFIVKWGFNTSLTELFSDFFSFNKKSRK